MIIKILLISQDFRSQKGLPEKVIDPYLVATDVQEDWLSVAWGSWE